MSEYISKSALSNLFEEKMADDKIMNPVIKILDVLEIIEDMPTIDEKEIIRKTAKRILGRLEYQEKQYESRAEKLAEALNSWEESRNRGKAYSYGYAIEIVKEECGINE